MTTPHKEITSGLKFPEGPVAMPDGSVILVEIARQTLTRVMPDGKQHVIAKLGGGPNGAAMGPKGKIYVTNNGGFNWIERPGGRLFPGTVSADYKGGSIQVVDPETGKFETLYDSCDGRKLNGPNDLVFDDAGGFWFTDLGKTRERDNDRGAVYYAKADGSKIEEKIFPLERPNGFGLSPDGKTLYVVETPTARCWAFELSGARRDQVGQRAVSRREGPGDRGPRRLPDVRFAGRRFGGPYLRRHADHRRRVRHLARRQVGDAVQAARPDGHQRLLRRQRPAHRLRHAVDDRQAGELRMAAAGPQARVPQQVDCSWRERRKPSRIRGGMAFGRNLMVLALLIFALGGYGVVMGALTLKWPRADATVTSAELLRQTNTSRGMDGRSFEDGWNSFHVLYQYRVGNRDYVAGGVEPYDFGIRTPPARRR